MEAQPLPIGPRQAHPPAGASTLIVRTVTRPLHLMVIEVAVALLVLQAIAINRPTGSPVTFFRRELQEAVENRWPLPSIAQCI
jgi:hypothetical protein